MLVKNTNNGKEIEFGSPLQSILSRKLGSAISTAVRSFDLTEQEFIPTNLNTVPVV